MTAIPNLLWGPLVGGVNSFALSETDFALDDGDDVTAFVFCCPKDGTISKIGLPINEVQGTPSQYQARLVTLDSSGEPTTTLVGGSAAGLFTPTATGWQSVSLATGASVSAGDLVCARVDASGSPDSSNHIKVLTSAYTGRQLPRFFDYSVGWSRKEGLRSFAVQYSDDEVYGLAATSMLGEQFDLNDSPDEKGNRFTLPVAMTVRGVRLECIGYSAANHGPDVTLYDADDTVLAETGYDDEDKVWHYTYGGPMDLFFDPVELAADTVYRLTIKSKSTTLGVRVNYFTFPDTNHKTGWLPDAANWQLTERTDGGTWTDYSLKVAPMGLIVTDLDLSGGSGGEGAKYWGFVG